MILDFVLDRTIIDTEEISAIEYVEDKKEKYTYISLKNNKNGIVIFKISYSEIRDLWIRSFGEPKDKLLTLSSH